MAEKPSCLNVKTHDRDCFDCNWFNACDNKYQDSHFQYNPMCLGKELGLHDGSVCVHCAMPTPEDIYDFKREECGVCV